MGNNDLTLQPSCAGAAGQQSPALKVFGRQQRAIALASVMASKSCRELPLVQHSGAEAKPTAGSPEYSSPDLLGRPAGGSAPASSQTISKSKSSKSAQNLRATIQAGLPVRRVWTLAAGSTQALPTGACVPAIKLVLSPASMQAG